MDLLLVKKHILKHIANNENRLSNINFPNGYHKGINLGNMLEAPNEGDWSEYFQDEYAALIKNWGFDFVRVPIRWSAHQTDGNIEPAFFNRVDYIISVILQNKLGAVVNIHHYDEMNSKPACETPILYKMWEQISQRYKNLPLTVSFELFNEPNTALTTAVWQPIQNKCIEIIRKTNPTRKIIVSAGSWGGISEIEQLVLPKDGNLVLSFHYYAPFQFTHQGAAFAGFENKFLGTVWAGTYIEKLNIETSFKKVRAWSQATGIPVLLGEFGAYKKAEYTSRVRWTTFVRETAEKYGFAWNYWELSAGFGIYDNRDGTVYEELVKALIPDLPNTVLGSATGMPKATAAISEKEIGPVVFHSIVPFITYSWTGITAHDTDNGVLLTLNNCIDWAHVNFPLDIIDTGSEFSKNTIEFNFRNIDNSITDLLFNIEAQSGQYEACIKGYDSVSIFKNFDGILQNADGTTTITLDISSVYTKMKGNFASGIELKVFIESVPNNSAWYDRVGTMEVFSITTK